MVVVDPRFGIDLGREVITASQSVTVTIDAIGSCVVLEPPQLDGDIIRLDVVEIGLCDPPPAPTTPFQFEAELGPYPPGNYLLHLYARSGPAATTRRVADARLSVLPAGSCLADEFTLCLNESRFGVTALWPVELDVAQAAFAVPSTDDTGFFWLFEEDNLELMVKVLDGCSAGFDSYWVFIGGVTDLEISVGVTDTATGQFKSYSSPGGSAFQTINDTSAFPCR